MFYITISILHCCLHRFGVTFHEDKMDIILKMLQY